MGALVQDFRYGLRALVKQPVYTVVAAVTVALAIGANTTIFSFANIFLLRPLPIEKSDEMAWMWWTNAHRAVDRGGLSIPDFLDLRAAQTTCESLAAFTGGSHVLTGRGDARRLKAMRVTANLLTTWRVHPVAGRLFADGEDAMGARPTVILSHHYWLSAFHGDRAAVGDALVLDGIPHTIVGVLAPEIEIGNISAIDVWTPLVADAALARDVRTVRVTGRRKPGVTIAQVDAEAKAIAKRLEADHRTTNAGWTARAVPTSVAITGANTWIILGLLGLVVGLILFIACANLANLVLVRGTARAKEIAVRAALGAGRLRLVRQLITESMLVGVIGGALGLALAAVGLRAMRAASAEPFFHWVTIDVRVMAFAFLLSLVAPLIFSVVPALRAARPDLNDALRDGARAGSDPRGHRGRAVLVVSQLTLALALLIVAGLAVRAMIAMARAPLGFEPHNLLTLNVELPAWKYRSDADVIRYWSTVLPAVRSMPGASAAAAASGLPAIDAPATVPFQIEGRAAPRPEDRPWGSWWSVSESYFRTIGVPVVAGRSFTDADVAEAPAVALVNEEAARRYWSTSTAPLGARIRPESTNGRPLTIVGVVANVKRPDLRGSDPAVYIPVTQKAERSLTMLIRGNQVTALSPAIRETLRAADVDVPIEQPRTMDEAFEDDLSSTRVLIGLFVAFGVLALSLAAAGLYGVMSYLVSQRVKEFGIRMALGAAPVEIRAMVRKQSLRLVTIGATLGLLAGAVLSRLTESLLYEVSALDPFTFGSATAILVGVAMVASALPIRRATQVDPIRALRTE